MNKLLEMAKRLETWMNNGGFSLLASDSTTLDTKVALWGLKESGKFVMTHPTGYDIYELLRTDTAMSIACKYDAIGVALYGRVIRPEVHPTIGIDRVRIVLCAKGKNIVSVSRFENNPDELTINKGNKGPLGDLCDAILHLTMKAHHIKS